MGWDSDRFRRFSTRGYLGCWQIVKRETRKKGNQNHIFSYDTPIHSFTYLKQTIFQKIPISKFFKKTPIIGIFLLPDCTSCVDCFYISQKRTMLLRYVRKVTHGWLYRNHNTRSSIYRMHQYRLPSSVYLLKYYAWVNHGYLSQRSFIILLYWLTTNIKFCLYTLIPSLILIVETWNF